MKRQILKLINVKKSGLLILLTIMTNGVVHSQTYNQIIGIAPTGVTSSTWDIRSNSSIQGNTAFIDPNDDKFYPIVMATSFLNNLGYWNSPAFGYTRPTFATQNNNYNGDIVIQNSGDGLATIRWKFKPDGSFVVPGNISLKGQILSKAPIGLGASSSIWDIGGSASFQGSTAVLNTDDNTFYPIVTASSYLNGIGYWNFPALGYTRPTFASQNNNYNGDVVIQNSGDGLSTIRWKFKPNGDFVVPGSINAQGGYFYGNFDVKGTIHAKEVKVDLNFPADYVFKPDYKLMTLMEVEQFIKVNSHLPEIPSAAEIKQNGLNMGDMQNKLLQKIEEMTLYMIEQNKEIQALKNEIKEMKAASK